MENIAKRLREGDMVCIEMSFGVYNGMVVRNMPDGRVLVLISDLLRILNVEREELFTIQEYRERQIAPRV